MENAFRSSVGEKVEQGVPNNAFNPTAQTHARLGPRGTNAAAAG